MPTYEFVCSGCRGRRETRAGMDEADGLVLVCTDCGGDMRKGVSRTVGLVVSASSTRSDQSGPSGTRRTRRKASTCADGSVHLTRPNPFRSELTEAPARGGPPA